MNGSSTGLELCPVCWVMAHTFSNDEGVQVMFWHRRPATGGGPCEGSHKPAKPADDVHAARVELGIDGDESRWEPTARDEHYPGAGGS